MVGGKIDFLVGSLCNGNKPILKMHEKSRDRKFRTVLLGSLLEGKKPSVSLYPLHSTSRTFTETVTQNATFENDEVPLMNIFGNRNTFRPLLYLKKYDVLLKTPKPFTFLDDTKTIHLIGLAMLQILFKIHRYPFKATELQGLLGGQLLWLNLISKHIRTL